MADSNTRQAARASATEGGAAAPKSRTPAPREETAGNNATDAANQQQAETPAVDPVLVVVAPNPKQPTSESYKFFEMYGKRGVATSVNTVRKAGVRGKDLSWDAERRHILVDHPDGSTTLASDFLALGDDRDAKAEMLKGLGVPEKKLIKWGYMDAPQPAPAATETAPQTQTADA